MSEGRLLVLLWPETFDLHLQLPYHSSSTAPVSTHDVRLPKESNVGDLLDALLQQLPAEKRPRELRLLEIFNGKIYQVGRHKQLRASFASFVWHREQGTGTIACVSEAKCCSSSAPKCCACWRSSMARSTRCGALFVCLKASMVIPCALVRQ